MTIYWVLYLVKAFFLALAVMVFLLIVGMFPTPGHNAKATGLAMVLHTRGELLLVAGLIQVIIGFVLMRLRLFIDGDMKLHVTFLR